jgi:NAD-dependent dihydropyrimidine dehydrogenase PreA subunit
MMSPDIIKGADSPNLMSLAAQSHAVFIIDDNECTRCAICVERCPTDALWLGRVDG